MAEVTYYQVRRMLKDFAPYRRAMFDGKTLRVENPGPALDLLGAVSDLESRIKGRLGRARIDEQTAGVLRDVRRLWGDYDAGEDHTLWSLPAGTNGLR